MLITPHPVDEHPVSTLVQPASFRRYRPFELQDAALGYVFESPTVVAQRVSKRNVVDAAQRLLDNPFASGVHYVSSLLDSERPNVFACFCARRALWLYDQGWPKKRRSNFGRPEFMYMYGSFNQIDKLMAKISQGWPILLVLAGLDTDSSNSKWDAARDIINMATRCDSSVIVSAAGCTPHQMHLERLRIPASSYVHLGNNDLQKSGSI